MGPINPLLQHIRNTLRLKLLFQKIGISDVAAKSSLNFFPSILEFQNLPQKQFLIANQYIEDAFLNGSQRLLHETPRGKKFRITFERVPEDKSPSKVLLIF